MKQICKLVVMLLLTFTAGVQAQLVTYPESLNPGIPHNDDYTVRVRIPGGEWKDLFEYNVQVDMDNVQKASMVQFDMGSRGNGEEEQWQRARSDHTPFE